MKKLIEKNTLLRNKYVRNIIEIAKATQVEMQRAHAPRHAGSLAFFSLFALAPLLFIVVALVGLFLGPGETQELILQTTREYTGPQVVSFVKNLLGNISDPFSSITALLFGLGTMFFGAIVIVDHLLDTFKDIWKNEKVYRETGLQVVLSNKLVGLLCIVGVGVAFLLSFLLNTVISLVQGYVLTLFPGAETLLGLFDFVFSILSLTIILALMFKYLPKVKLTWRDVIIPAVFCGIALHLLKFFLILYVSFNQALSLYGAAGSLLVVMIFLYMTSYILVIGAVLTKVLSQTVGSRQPSLLHRVYTSIKESIK